MMTILGGTYARHWCVAVVLKSVLFRGAIVSGIIMLSEAQPLFSGPKMLPVIK